MAGVRAVNSQLADMGISEQAESLVQERMLEQGQVFSGANCGKYRDYQRVSEILRDGQDSVVVKGALREGRIVGDVRIINTSTAVRDVRGEESQSVRPHAIGSSGFREPSIPSGVSEEPADVSLEGGKEYSLVQKASSDSPVILPNVFEDGKIILASDPSSGGPSPEFCGLQFFGIKAH